MESKGREGLGTTLLVSHSTRHTHYQYTCQVIARNGVGFPKVMLIHDTRNHERGGSSHHYIAR
jgi:hypothetical protein